MDAAARRELDVLIETIRQEDRATIARYTADELAHLHFGLGLYIRNQIYSQKLPALHKWASDTSITDDPDHQSGVIILEIWKFLRLTQSAQPTLAGRRNVK